MLFPTWPSPISEPGVGITDSSRTQFAILALTALLLSGYHGALKPDVREARWWLGGFFLWSTLSCLWGPDVIGSLLFTLNWIAAGCVLLAAPAVLTKPLDTNRQLLLIHLPLLVLAVLCLGPMPTATEEFRAAGPFQLPGTLATWLLMILPLALTALMQARRSKLALALLSSTLGVSTLVMTVSRAAWLIGLLELVMFCLLEAKVSRKGWLLWGGFGLLGSSALILSRHLLGGTGLLTGFVLLALAPILTLLAQKQLPRPSFLRLVLVAALSALFLASAQPQESLGDFTDRRLATLSQTDESAVGRLQFWQAALTLSFQHPWLGVAPGRFSEAYPQVQQHFYYFSDSAHGTVVELLADVGWIGSGLLLLGLSFLFLSSRSRLKHSDGTDDSFRQAALLGVGMGFLYSQVEVSYHFASIWTTGAFLLALAAAPARSSSRYPTPWLAPFLAALLVVLLAVVSWQRSSEESTRQLDPRLGYHQARAVSDKIPAWSRPTLNALTLGLRANLPAEELTPLVQRALKWAPENSASHQLAGEVELRQERYAQAQAHFARSLELDPYNRPGSYHGLLLVASATNNDALAEETSRQALQIYDIDKGWSIAHTGHREKIALELRPLLYDVADRLNPNLQPEPTARIYRFLLETGEPEPRALYGLGVALTTQGNREEGERLMRQAHELDPLYPLP